MDGWISFFLFSSPHSGQERGGASTDINPDHFLEARLLCKPVCLSLMEAAKKVILVTHFFFLPKTRILAQETLSLC